MSLPPWQWLGVTQESLQGDNGVMSRSFLEEGKTSKLTAAERGVASTRATWGIGERERGAGYPQTAWLLSQLRVLLGGFRTRRHRGPAGFWGVGCGCAVLGRAVPPGDSFLEPAGLEAAFFASSRLQQAGGWGGVLLQLLCTSLPVWVPAGLILLGVQAVGSPKVNGYNGSKPQNRTRRDAICCVPLAGLFPLSPAFPQPAGTFPRGFLPAVPPAWAAPGSGVLSDGGSV
uniref:Uncharacterized protein n=1 Tax=Myotis myotis TaxID=51298 RepID=A0A7J7Y0P0_MYOMY|nr:hypothetical protein mMyoMyo1_011526 [Myotis myotis]